MFKFKKFIFKQIIFLASYIFKTNHEYWLISLSHGGGSFEAENCKKFADFMKKKKSVKIKCVSDKKLKGLQKFIIKPFSLEYLYYSIFSRYLVVENDLHNDLPGYRSKGTYKVNLFHGMAVKKIYHSSLKIQNIFKRKLSNTLRRYLFGFCFTDEYDLICVTNNFHKKKYQSAFKNKNVKVLGQPRNDFISNNKLVIRNKILKDLGCKSEIKKIILHLPTFRDKNIDFGKNELSFFRNEKFQKYLISKKAIILSKQHFFHKKNIFNKNIKFKKISNNIFLLNKISPTYDLLNIADCLITDYSSVYIDFLLLNKPIIFYCHDIDNYIRYHRELYFNYFDDKFTPGKKIFNERRLEEEIIKFLKNYKDKFSNKRKISNKFFNKFVDNNNSKRIYNFVIKN